MSQGNRVRRVEEMVKRVISEALIGEVDIPHGERVTVTKVDMSPDLRNAKVFFSILAETEEEKQTIFQGVRKRRKEIRRIVGREMELRLVPSLKFEIDNTAEEAARIEALIQKIHEEDRSREG